jgi:hypothetical protein
MRCMRIAVLLLTGILPVQSWAVDCTPANIELSSQADVDNFQANHGPCDHVVGSLGGFDVDDIGNLNGLSAITSIGGGVNFAFNSALIDLNGLSALTSAGSLTLEFNTALQNVDGLSSLTDVEFDLRLESNTVLANVQGLSALTSVGGSLTVKDIQGLADLEGLHGIPSLGGDLLIQYNHALLSVDLTSLVSIGGDISIQNNDALTHLDGLSGLIGVGNDLLVAENPELDQCAGLTRLLDDVDDGDPGPGPGLDGIPDVGNQAIFNDNLAGCNSISEIMTIFKDGFESPPKNIITELNDPGSEIGEQNSIAIGTDGLPVISYHDRTTGSLKVAKCNDVACAGQDETISTVDDPENKVGWYNSMAIGTDNYPIISYHDETAGLLKVAKCDDPACAGGNETITTIDGLVYDVGDYSSIAIGTDTFPVISYYDRSFGNLKVAKCNDTACAGGDETITTVDGLSANLGQWSSLAIGTDGFPVIAYNDFSPAETLKVVKCNDPACSGDDETITTVDGLAGSVGHFNSLAIGTDGFPVISYHDFSSAQALKVTKCNDAACTGDSETTSVVDDPENSVGAWTSLAIDSDGFPVISYFDSTAGALKVAKCNDTACAGGDETITTVDNLETTGLLSSIIIGSDGLPVISYQNNTTKTLKILHCGSDDCRP